MIAIRSRWCWRVWPLLLCSLLLASLMASAAPFQVKQVDSYLNNGVYYLDARFGLQLGEAPELALRNGVPLQITFEMEVLRRREWWLNESVAELSQRYRLEYHELSRRYLVFNLNTGLKRSFLSLSSALAQIGALQGFPLLDGVLLKKPGHYFGRIRADLDISQLPLPLIPQAYFSSEWQLSSEWYQWSLN